MTCPSIEDVVPYCFIPKTLLLRREGTVPHAKGRVTLEAYRCDLAKQEPLLGTRARGASPPDMRGRRSIDRQRFAYAQIDQVDYHCSHVDW